MQSTIEVKILLPRRRAFLDILLGTRGKKPVFSLGRQVVAAEIGFTMGFEYISDLVYLGFPATAIHHF